MSSVSFILHKPQLSENVGACARAIKNFNFNKLAVINPKPVFPNDKIIATSVGAKEIIKNCIVYENLESAIKNVDYLIATSSRFRNKNIKHISLNELSKIDFSKKVAFLFGSEASEPNKNATLLLKSTLFKSSKLICLIFLFLNLDVVEIKTSISLRTGLKLS